MRSSSKNLWLVTVPAVALGWLASLAFAAPRGGGVVPGPQPAPSPKLTPEAAGGPLAAIFGNWDPPADPTARGATRRPKEIRLVLGKEGGAAVARTTSGQKSPDVILQDYSWPADAAKGTPEVSSFAVLQVGSDGTSVTMWLWTNLWVGPTKLTGTVTQGGGYEVEGTAPKAAAVRVTATPNGNNVDVSFSYALPAQGSVSTSRSNIKNPPS